MTGDVFADVTARRRMRCNAERSHRCNRQICSQSRKVEGVTWPTIH